MVLVATLLAALIVPAGAAVENGVEFYEVDGPSVAKGSVETVPGELDRLFDALRSARNAAEARPVESRIWRAWLQAPDRRAASRMNRNIKYREYGEYWDSMDQVNHVIRRFPRYAEAWNQRAFLHFLQGDYEASIRDCRRTLELEPRHFGCMSGMARAFIRLEREDEARAILTRALAIHPFLPERRLLKRLGVPRVDL